ncbi:MAG: mechanosensitive ion channel family protein [bacterium]|nr:mechanosensitive ion channel family protein [bacterium]
MLEKILIPQIYLPAIYITIAILLNGICKKIINGIIKKKQKKLNKNSLNYKKIETFTSVINNIVKYVILVVLLFAILTVYGINVTSVLAGLGIVGVIVGLALQDFAKDIVAGLSIILENQYTVGDTISVGGFKGEVIFLGLKTTRIKNWEGKVKILANHCITEVINYNMANSVAIVDVRISYEEDIEKVEGILAELVKQLSASLPNLKGEVELLGVESLDSSAIIFRMMAQTVPLEHYKIQREIRRQVKICLEKNKIKIPYPQIEVHNGK